ncbi:MAG: carbohydrate ABC transporter permease [Limnochordia bacterium]
MSQRKGSIKIQYYIRMLATYVILILAGISFAMPFFWMVSSSLKPINEIFLIPIQWLPKTPQWHNYREAFSVLPLGRYFLNSAIVTGLNIVGSLVSCTLAAYGFARLNFWGRDALFFALIATMMLPFQVTIIPLFVLFSRLGWVNTFRPLIVPSFFGNAFYIFLMRQYFSTIPRDLEEAAIIDGCGTVRTFFSIILPLTKPALVTVMLFTFMGVWNDFFNALIYISSPSKFTIALGLSQFRSEFGSYWHLLMAGSTAAILPCLLLFFFFQRYFLEGIASTGLKG